MSKRGRRRSSRWRKRSSSSKRELELWAEGATRSIVCLAESHFSNTCAVRQYLDFFGRGLRFPSGFMKQTTCKEHYCRPSYSVKTTWVVMKRLTFTLFQPTDTLAVLKSTYKSGKHFNITSYKVPFVGNKITRVVLGNYASHRTSDFTHTKAIKMIYRL